MHDRPRHLAAHQQGRGQLGRRTSNEPVALPRAFEREVHSVVGQPVEVGRNEAMPVRDRQAGMTTRRGSELVVERSGGDLAVALVHVDPDNPATGADLAHHRVDQRRRRTGDSRRDAHVVGAQRDDPDRRVEATGAQPAHCVHSRCRLGSRRGREPTAARFQLERPPALLLELLGQAGPVREGERITDQGDGTACAHGCVLVKAGRQR